MRVIGEMVYMRVMGDFYGRMANFIKDFIERD